MNKEEIIKRLDRIERMLFTLLNKEEQKKYNQEKTKEYEMIMKSCEYEFNKAIAKTMSGVKE